MAALKPKISICQNEYISTPRYTYLEETIVARHAHPVKLHVLAYNLKRVIAMLGPQPLIDAIRA